MAAPTQAVTVSLQDLKNGAVSLETLQQAFGPDSLGIIVIKDMPPEFRDLRHQALSYASHLGNLSPSALTKLENPRAKWLTGWSLGKEMLKNGQVDTLKGSYYANCAFYVDPSLEGARAPGFGPGTGTGIRFDEDTFPEYLSPNVWPDDADLPGFRAALESLCRLMIDVAMLVARACDRFAEREIPGYEPGYLERVVGTSTTTKARLLHYFPRQQAQNQGSSPTSSPPNETGEDDDWCATHLDHGCLTALTSAMFVDEACPNSKFHSAAAAAAAASRGVDGDDAGGGGGGDCGVMPPLQELPASPDPAAGLYIRSRAGQTAQVAIPRDCLAFQTGEALERITRGRFKAVPHFVRGPKMTIAAGAGAAGEQQRKLARNTLAVFTQPNLEELVDAEAGLTFGEFARGIVARNTVG